MANEEVSKYKFVFSIPLKLTLTGEPAFNFKRHAELRRISCQELLTELVKHIIQDELVDAIIDDNGDDDDGDDEGI